MVGFKTLHNIDDPSIHYVPIVAVVYDNVGASI